MFNYAVTFFVLAIIASVLGFGGVAGLSAQVGWFFAVVGVALLVLAVVTGRRGSLTRS
jgi:uncharacterized membrane protein YtjA (UPF0391 family)